MKIQALDELTNSLYEGYSGISLDVKPEHGNLGFFRKYFGRIEGYMKRVACIGLVTAVLAGGMKAMAATYHVNPTKTIQSTIDNVDDEAMIENNRLSWANDQSNIQYPSIQAAIDAAANGDTIILGRGIFTGYGNRDIDFSGKAITVRSTDPNNPNIVATTIIDCNGTETEPHRGFYFRSGEDANSILAGITIINGYAAGSWPTYAGGVIYCHNSSLTLINCTFMNNFAEYDGGGMYNNQSNPTLINCTFTENSADYGGGIYNCFFSNPTLINCRFSANSAETGGGMSNNYNSSPILVNCIFNGNLATDWGGGMDNFDNSNPTLINCIFNSNSAHDEGGGMNNDYSSPTLINCILSGNSAGKGGNQIHVRSGTAIVNYSCIQGSWPGRGNIDADPFFADPNNNDYHLKSQAGHWNPKIKSWVKDNVTSPCIDAGDPSYPIMYEPFPNGGRINMGVYGGTAKASKSYFGKPNCETIVAGDINGDCKVDLYDFALMALHWLEDRSGE